MKVTSTVVGRIALILLFFYFSIVLFTSSQPWIFIDGANLIIHEGGHMIFIFFGQFLRILGGSLTQIVVPCLFFGYFLRRKEYFSTAAMLFWIGDNIINVSIYMKDAIAMQLPLLGGDGVIHDWHWLFSTMGILPYSQIIGTLFFIIGALCVIVSLLGMCLFTYIEAAL